MWPQHFSPITLGRHDTPVYVTFALNPRITHDNQLLCGLNTDQSLSPSAFSKRAETLYILTAITIPDVVDRQNAILRAFAPLAITLRDGATSPTAMLDEIIHPSWLPTSSP